MAIIDYIKKAWGCICHISKTSDLCNIRVIELVGVGRKWVSLSTPNPQIKIQELMLLGLPFRRAPRCEFVKFQIRRRRIFGIKIFRQCMV